MKYFDLLKNGIISKNPIFVQVLALCPLLAVKGNFYRQFNSRELVRLNVTRSSPGENEIQAITSSTVTTRAVTGAVNEAIEWYLRTHIPYRAKDEHNESADSENGGENE